MPCKPLYRSTHTLYSHNFALEGAIFALEAPYLLFALLLMISGIYLYKAAFSNTLASIPRYMILSCGRFSIRTNLHQAFRMSLLRCTQVFLSYSSHLPDKVDGSP